MNKSWAPRLSLVAGFLLILLTIPHYMLGYPNVSKALMEANVDVHLITTVQVIWVFSSLTMLGTGLVVVAVALLYRHDRRLLLWVNVIVGLTLFTFTLIGLKMSWPDAHLSIFGLPALLCFWSAVLVNKENTST